MNWTFHPYAVPLFVGAAVMLGIALISVRRRSMQGAAIMALLSLSITIYMVGYAFELGSSRLSDIFFWIHIEYIGVTTSLPLLFMLLLIYTNNDQFLTPLNVIILFIIPAISLILAWTNAQHEWLWADARLETWEQYTVIDFSPGGWYRVLSAYIFLLLAVGTALLIQAYFRVTGLYRRQVGIFLLSVSVPLITYFIYAFDVLPIPLDLNPYALTLTAIFIAWGMFNYQFLDIMPVAREAALASMPDSVIVIDVHKRLVEMNPAAQQLFSLDLGRCIGQPVADVLALWPRIMAEFDESSTHPRHEIALQIHGKDYYFDIYSSRLGNKPGQHSGFLIVLRDVTARALAEMRLKATNEQLANLRQADAELTRKLSVRYVMGIALDVALRTSQADAAFIALMEGRDNLRIKHCQGRCYSEAAVNTLIPLDNQIVAQLIQTRETQMSFGSSTSFTFARNIQAHILAPLLSGEKLIGVMGLETSHPENFTPAIFETITLLAARAAVAIDNSNMYEEREKLIKELDAFARTVAHDLKSPLAVIVGYSLFLKEDYEQLTSEQMQEYVDILVQTSQKTINIVNELLTLASVRKMEDIPIEPLKMADIIAEARSRLRSQIDDSGATITVPDQWLIVNGYAPWVEEVWANYLSNAIKYGGKPPIIECGATSQPDGFVRFWVRDNGQGLTPEQQSKLFTEFSRVDYVKVEGHGLGLSIVQRIIDRLGGQVGVESAVGQGSTFSFTLPAV